MNTQTIYYRFMGLESQLYEKDSLEIGTIIYRHKSIEGDMASPSDFIWYRKEVTNCQTLLTQLNWSMYVVDEKFVYFVLMPKPAAEYTVKIAPFVYMKQYEDCIEVARCTLENFFRLTDDLEHSGGLIVYESSAARSGSTLMAQLLQATNKCSVFGEPDAFTALTNMIDKNQMENNQIESTVRALIRFLCKSQKKSEIYVIKTQSNCIRLVPYIKKVCPDVKHFFMFRTNTRRILTSLEKIVRRGSGGEEIVFLWNKFSPSVACWLVNFANFEYGYMKRFGIKDCMDIAILTHIHAYHDFIKHRNLFDLPWVLYENLASKPSETLKSVLELCEIPLDAIQDALKVFNSDSQAGTILSQESMKNVKSVELTDDKVEKINEICNILTLPLLEI